METYPFNNQNSSPDNKGLTLKLKHMETYDLKGAMDYLKFTDKMTERSFKYNFLRGANRKIEHHNPSKGIYRFTKEQLDKFLSRCFKSVVY